MADNARSAAEIFGRICEAEERLNLFQHQLDGWCVWPIFRKTVADRLGGTQHATASGVSAGRGWILPHALRDIGKLARLERSETLVKTYSSGLLDRDDDGRYRDIWFDDLLDELGAATKIEALNSTSFLSRRPNRVRPESLTTSLSSLIGNSVVPRMPASREVRRVADALAAVLAEAFGDVLSANAIVAVLAGFQWERRFYKTVLRWVKPRRVLIADYGEYALASVAKEMSVPVLELQHGVTDRYHPAYSWTAAPLNYRDKMPIADRLLVYGEFWKEEMETGGYWNGYLDVTGSPRIDRWRARKLSWSERRRAIVLTTQGIHSRALAEIVRSAAAVAGADLEILIKLHPVFEGANRELADLLEGCPRVTIIPAADAVSTLDLLGKVKLHASVSSATHFDALALGTPTAVIALPGHEVVLPLVTRGDAKLVRSGEDMVSVFSAAAEVPANVGACYFSTDALRRTRAAVEAAGSNSIQTAH